MHRHAPLVALALALAGCRSSESAGAEAPAPAPAPAAPWITDETGRAMVLHGINVDMGAKGARVPAIDRTDVDRIAKTWGFDFVRYLITWEAVEPQPGQYDDAYLDAVVEQIGWFHDAGVSVLVDMHQDVYARRFCCDGAPEWAIADDGLPFELQPIWGFNYQQPAVVRAFDNFWDASGPHADLQEHFAGAWRHVAARMRGVAGVVGYDVINEPYPGSDFDNAEVVTRVTPEDGGPSRRFDETKLGPFYQRMIDAIRGADPDRWVFFEPRYGSPGNGSPSFLPALVDPRAGEPRLAYVPHLYSTTVETSGTYGTGDRTVASWEAERTKELARQAMPLVVGEWGFAWSTANADRYAHDVLAMADRMRAGWAYWAYGPGGPTSWSLYDESGADNPQADLAVRAYPRRVAGTPVAWSFDASSRVFELDVAAAPGVSGPTEIVLPRRHYPAGYTVDVTPDAAGSWSSAWDADRGVLSLVLDASVSEHHVRVAPK